MARGAGKAKRGCGCVHGPRRGPRRGFDAGGFVEAHPGIAEHPDMHTQGEEFDASRGVPQAFRTQANPMIPGERNAHGNLILNHFNHGGSVRRGRR